MNEDDIKQIVDRVLLTIKHAEEPEWNILYDYVTKLQNNWNELMEDIPHILEMVEHNKDVIKVTSDEELAIYSLQNKMQELEGNND